MGYARAQDSPGGVDSDDALLRGVYEQHGQAVLAYVTRLTADRAGAEDILQETLVRAWRHRDVLVNGRGSVRAWMLTVAGRIVVDLLAPRNSPREVGELPGCIRWSATTRIGSWTRWRCSRRCRNCPQQRDAIVQLYFRGCSMAEAAQSLGVPEGTVKSRVHYGLLALRSSSPGRGRSDGGSGMSDFHDPHLLDYAVGLLNAPTAGRPRPTSGSARAVATSCSSSARSTPPYGRLPPELFLDGPPQGGELALQRAMRQVREEKTRHRGVHRGRRRAVLVAAAATVAALVGGGSWLIGHQAGLNETTGQVTALPAAASRLLIRRVRLDVSAGQVSADPRARRRRSLHPDQRGAADQRAATAGRRLRLLVHRDQPGRVHR